MRAVLRFSILAISCVFLLPGVCRAEVSAPVIKVNGFTGTNEIPVVTRGTITISGGSANRIFYTLDGSEPSFASSEYRSSFDVSTDTQIRAIAYDADYNASPVTSVLVRIVPGYYLDVIPSATSLEISPLMTLYPSNTIVTLRITSLHFWRFLKWTGDVDESDTNLTIQVTMDRNKRVKVVLETDLYLKTVGAGRANADVTTNIVLGTDVKLTAVPDPGNYFVGWDGIGGGSLVGDSPVLYQVGLANHILTALFAPLPENTQALNLTSDGPGSFLVTPPGRHFTNDTTVTLSAQPAPGSVFHRWTGDVEGTNPVISVSMDSTKNISAEFESLLKWVLPLPLYPIPLAGTPSISPDGSIYLCSNSNLVGISRAPAVKWTRSFPLPLQSWPMVGDDGTVYVTCQNGSAAACSPEGDLIWEYWSGVDAASNFHPASALGEDNTVYVATGAHDGELLAIKNGVLKWRFPLDAYGFSKIAINSDGNIFLASKNSYRHYTAINEFSPAGDLVRGFTNSTVLSDLNLSINREDEVMLVTESFGGFLFDAELHLLEQVTNSVMIGESEPIFTSSLGFIDYRRNEVGNYLFSLFNRNFQPQWTNVFDSYFTDQSMIATSSGDTLVTAVSPVQLMSFSNAGRMINSMPMLTQTLYTPVMDWDGTLFVASHELAWHHDVGPNLIAFRTPYSPADSGWPMFGANPQHTFRVSRSKLKLSIDGGGSGSIDVSTAPPSGASYSLDFSTNLISWESVLTFEGPLNTNLPAFAPSGFYRLRQSP
jgi:hypothetical protein